MKKSILIFSTVLAAFNLMSFSYLKRNASETLVCDNDRKNIFEKKGDNDLLYNVDSRFGTTVTKENLNKATSIIDILPEKATKSIESYQEVKVSVLFNDIGPNELEATEIGEGDKLNRAQIKLLKSTDYSTNIHIRANYRSLNAVTGELEDSYLVYYMTITSEKEAEFKDGEDALIEFLRENSKGATTIIKQDQLKPAKVGFTVTKKGTITDVNLKSTSGYSTVDEALVELIETMPEKWNPATNSKGDNVDQQLIFFFGLKGC